jgi:hypothetical protein
VSQKRSRLPGGAWMPGRIFAGRRFDTRVGPRAMRARLLSAAGVGELVQSTTGQWIARPPQHCPRGHLLRSGRFLVGSIACSCGRHLRWRCECGALTWGGGARTRDQRIYQTVDRDGHLAGWRKRVVPTLGHLAITMVTNGAVDRAVHGWISDECSRSTVKNSVAVLVRVMEQAVRDGIIDRNPARVSGWQGQYKLAEDELDDPRSLALRDWAIDVSR